VRRLHPPRHRHRWLKRRTLQQWSFLLVLNVLNRCPNGNAIRFRALLEPNDSKSRASSLVVHSVVCANNHKPLPHHHVVVVVFVVVVVPNNLRSFQPLEVGASGGGGGGPDDFGSSGSTIQPAPPSAIRFSDIGGADALVQESMYILLLLQQLIGSTHSLVSISSRDS
jgi:hypothetical protein